MRRELSTSYIKEIARGPIKTPAQKKANEQKIIALRKLEVNKVSIGA